MINVTDTHGYIGFNEFSITWGNPIPDLELAGFCAISFGRFSLEFGDVDQGKPGIYTTTYTDDEITGRTILWEAP